MAQNKEAWLDVYDLDIFRVKTTPAYNRLWEWTEKLEASGRLREVDILALKEILTAAVEVVEENQTEN